MGASLTPQQVLESGRPAYSEELDMRFVPGKGFYWEGGVHFGPAWLGTGIPKTARRWYHQDDCDCALCRPQAPLVATPAVSESGEAVPSAA